MRFGLHSYEETRETSIIVVRTHSIETGIVVDRMSEVLDIENDQIEEPPSFGAVDTSYILGIAKSNDKVKLLLDIEEVLSEEELKEINHKSEMSV
jgi:purine-binding chemotaxis protein CheW